MDTQRAHVKITGKVQGVGFRAACRDQARQIGVQGWVKNMSNGSVEAVFEGSQAAVQRMISWCYSGPMAAKVDHVEATWEAATGKEYMFDIYW